MPTHFDTFKDKLRNVLALEDALARANEELENLWAEGGDKSQPQLPLRDFKARERAASSAPKPKKSAKRARKPKADGAVKLGRKPSPDSAASKVLASFKGGTNYTAANIVENTGLELKQVQSAIGQLRHNEKIATVERGLYTLAQ